MPGPVTPTEVLLQKISDQLNDLIGLQKGPGTSTDKPADTARQTPAKKAAAGKGRTTKKVDGR